MKETIPISTQTWVDLVNPDPMVQENQVQREPTLSIASIAILTPESEERTHQNIGIRK